MILNGSEIRQRLLNDSKSDNNDFDAKLIITPILEFDEQLKEDAVSIDLRLGSNFIIFNKSLSSHVDQENKEYTTRSEISYREVKIGDKIVLHSKQFILGESLEWVKMPNDLAGLLTAKSSDAREGIQIETANLIHPRFSGTITFELKNNGELPIALYPGLSIGQLSFIKLNTGITSRTPISKSTFPFSFRPRVINTRKKDFEIIKIFKSKL